MKLAIKKIYCTSCKRLVKTQEQKNKDRLDVTCPRCNRILWTRTGSVLRYVLEPK
jgi:hypothetical protein